MVLRFFVVEDQGKRGGKGKIVDAVAWKSIDEGRWTRDCLVKRVLRVLGGDCMIVPKCRRCGRGGRVKQEIRMNAEARTAATGVGCKTFLKKGLCLLQASRMSETFISPQSRSDPRFVFPNVYKLAICQEKFYG